MAHQKVKLTHMENHPVLPDGMQRSDVERLIRRCAPVIGMNDGQLIVLLSMIEETRPSDWINPDFEPVCFARQTNIAASSGKDERTVRRIEHQLEHRFGFLVKDVGQNGQRCRYRFCGGTEFRQGLVFSPLVEKIPDLRAIAQQIENARALRIVVKQKISAAKRAIRERMDTFQESAPTCTSLAEIGEVFQSWPTRFYASVPLETLQDHLGEVLDLHDRLESYSHQREHQAVEEAVDAKWGDPKVRPQMSCPADIHDRPVQDTNQEIYVLSKTGEYDQAVMTEHKHHTERAKFQTKQKCAEISSNVAVAVTKTNFLESMTPTKLFNLCSRTMQDNIRLYQGEAPYPTELNFTFAALDQAHALGITKWAYDLATQQMGDLATALCILIIDRNIHHPVTPIKSPGGVLRAMTARHANGSLNIERSLIGIENRLSTLTRHN